MHFSKLILTLLCIIGLMPQSRQDRNLTVTRPATNEQRIALVIGNGAYAQGALTNPVNDARDIAATLRNAGFEVLSGANQNRRQMREMIRQFGEKIRNGGVGLFYFAGHGVQVNNTNYLIPVGAEITKETEVEDESISVNFVLAQMEDARNKLNIVILDACRNNPFARSFRSGSRGLAVTKSAPTGTLVAYATAADNVASDGDGRNGLFTQELLANLKTPGLTLESVFRRTRTTVRSKSKGQQVPYEYTSVEGEDFYFTPPTNGTLPPPVVTPVPVASTPPPKPGVGTVRKNSLGMEFAYIPAGSFLMGSTEEDINRVVAANNPMDDQVNRDLFKSELPQHRVTISQPFYLGRYEVTQKQWEQVMGTTVQQQRDKANPNFNLSNVGPNQPMYFVSWEEAQELIRKLNERNDGFVYRLPMEAEWEYACRAGTNGDYAGNLNTLGWYGDNSGREQRNSLAEWVKSERNSQKYYDQFLKPNGNGTHEVGMKAPNPWGVYDMHGNVYEWCEDWYGDYASGNQTDPTGAANGQYRVRRGGSWSYVGRICRAAYRSRNAPGVRSDSIGFRVVVAARTP